MASGQSPIIRRKLSDDAVDSLNERIDTESKRFARANRGLKPTFEIDYTPIDERFGQLTRSVRMNEDGTEEGATRDLLDGVVADATTFVAFTTANAALISTIHETFKDFRGPAGAGPTLAMMDVIAVRLGGEKFSAMRNRVARRIQDNEATAQDLEQVRDELYRLVIPSSEELETSRGVNEDATIAALDKMIKVGLMEPAKMVAPWKSSFDVGRDQFGAGWSLRSNVLSGKAQWVRTWEYHIHGEALRDGTGQVIGFNIKRGHVKPTKSAKATGKSIHVTNPAFEAKVKADELPKFLRWANNGQGKTELAKTK
ncbi:hypothetical protein GCM10023340_08930 [Nocardioides marinquilinus]|uniref:Uncharacterized protein n=1 Tax=Nocardioides marinquilinus TaxID=1210400 RepID=A0ABP9PAI1_9ACTN